MVVKGGVTVNSTNRLSWNMASLLYNPTVSNPHQWYSWKMASLLYNPAVSNPHQWYSWNMASLLYNPTVSNQHQWYSWNMASLQFMPTESLCYRETKIYSRVYFYLFEIGHDLLHKKWVFIYILRCNFCSWQSATKFFNYKFAPCDPFMFLTFNFDMPFNTWA